MNESKFIIVKLLLAIIIPFIAVTIGGFIVYQTPSAFFFSSGGQNTAESNGPAVIYYSLTLVITLMFFLMKQKYRWYEVIAFLSLSMVYAISLKQLTPGVDRPLYLYFIPLVLMFALIWLILKYIFLNIRMRSMRLILFSLLSSAAFSLAFLLQYIMLKLPMDGIFMQSRFFSGLMLFIFMGFGLSMAELSMIKLDLKLKGKTPEINNDNEITNSEEDGETS
jgi:hypothetical protein